MIIYELSLGHLHAVYGHVWSCIIYTLGHFIKNAIHHIPGFPCSVLLQKPSFSSAPRLLEVQL